MFLSDLQNRFQWPSVLSFLSHQHSVFSFKADSVDVRAWEELAKLASQIKACATACTNKQGNDMGRLAEWIKSAPTHNVDKPNLCCSALASVFLTNAFLTLFPGLRNQFKICDGATNHSGTKMSKQMIWIANSHIPCVFSDHISVLDISVFTIAFFVFVGYAVILFASIKICKTSWWHIDLT